MADNNNNNSGGFKGWMSGWNTERVSAWFSVFKSSFTKKENDGSMAVEKVTFRQKMLTKWADLRTRFPQKKVATPNEVATPNVVATLNEDGTPNEVATPNKDGTISIPTTNQVATPNEVGTISTTTSDSSFSNLVATISEKITNYQLSWSKKEEPTKTE